MTNDHQSQRHDGDRLRDSPWSRCKTSQIHHSTSDWKHNSVHVLELVTDLWNFQQEVRVFDFLLGHFPSHFVTDNMSDQSFVDVEAQTTEIETVHRLPFEVFPERTKQRAFTDTKTHDSKGDVAEKPEH